MRRLLPLAAALLLILAIAPAASAGELVTRAWQDPVAIGDEGLFDSDAALAPLGRIVSTQQRSGARRIGVTETGGFSGEQTDTTLWGGPGGYYPRLAVSPTGDAAAAYSDGTDLHVHVRRPGGQWHEVGALFEGQTDFSDGRPLLAYTTVGRLVVAWPRKDAGGGQRVWLATLEPGSDELSEPQPLDPPDPGVVQVARDLAVGAGGRVALAYLQGPSRQAGLTAHVAFGTLDDGLAERHALPGLVTPWSWRAPQVDFDLLGNAAIAWYTVPDGFDQGAAIGDLHLVLRRADGTLGPTTELGQTPGDFQLAVSDLGEVLLGYESAGNLSGGGCCWGYSGYGYFGVLGSTVLGRIGTPALLVAWPAYGAQLAMNRRGDAVVAYEECCDDGDGIVRARRRLPGGSFDDAVLVARGPLTHANESSYYGPSVREVVLDEIGNAGVTWTGFGPLPLGMNAAVDGPLLELGLPGLPIGVELPPILPPLPKLPDLPELPDLPGVPQLPGLPPLPGIPLTVTTSALMAGRSATAPPVPATPLELSVSAGSLRGVPRGAARQRELRSLLRGPGKRSPRGLDAARVARQRPCRALGAAHREALDCDEAARAREPAPLGQRDGAARRHRRGGERRSRRASAARRRAPALRAAARRALGRPSTMTVRSAVATSCHPQVLGVDRRADHRRQQPCGKARHGEQREPGDERHQQARREQAGEQAQARRRRRPVPPPPSRVITGPPTSTPTTIAGTAVADSWRASTRSSSASSTPSARERRQRPAGVEQRIGRADEHRQHRDPRAGEHDEPGQPRSR